MSGSNGTGAAAPVPAAPSPPGPSPAEHWSFQVDSPFRGPAEIRELASVPRSVAADAAPGAGVEGVFGEDLPPPDEEFEAYDEFEAGSEDEAYDEAAFAEADLFEETPASEHPLAAVFSLPRLAFDAMAKGGWATAIAIAIGAGVRDVNKLTNMIFWFRHPQLIGQKVRADQRDLAREWLSIRDQVVKPALARGLPTTPPAASEPSGPSTPTPSTIGGRTAIPSDGLRWFGPATEETPELMAFMRKVYALHVKRSKGDFVDTLPDAAIEEVEPGSGKKARKDAARKAREMLAAARARLAAEGLTGTVRIGILSAYRSADHQFDIWQGKTTKGTGGFPHYYKATKATRGKAQYGGEHSDKSAAYLAEYMAQYIAAPGYSNHQDGLALDLGTRKGRGRLIKLYKGSWFHDWMNANACTYQFVPLPSEAWHWTYRPAAGGSASEAWGFESPAPSPSAEAWASEVTPTEIKAGRFEVARISLLANHRGNAPDLILRWNDMPTVPAEIDVVVHLHGYSWATMTLPKHMEVWAGLDLAPVDGASGTGRTRPTLTVLPRGHFTGVQVGKIYRYTFPALTTKDGMTTLVRVALKEFSDRVGGLPPKVGRLILTAHSGGGAPLMHILRRHDADEVHVFDGLYQDATALAEWASRHIKADRAAGQGGGTPTGAMRVLFRPGTQAYSLRLLKAIAPDLEGAPAAIADRYRVESSTLGHWQIPRQYGWRLLADAAMDVPEARRPKLAGTAAKRLYESDGLEALDDVSFAEADEGADEWELDEVGTEAETEGRAYEAVYGDTEHRETDPAFEDAEVAVEAVFGVDERFAEQGAEGEEDQPDHVEAELLVAPGEDEEDDFNERFAEQGAEGEEDQPDHVEAELLVAPGEDEEDDFNAPSNAVGPMALQLDSDDEGANTEVRRADAEFALLVKEFERLSADSDAPRGLSEEIGLSGFLPSFSGVFKLDPPSPTADISVAVPPFNALRRLSMPVKLLDAAQSSNAISWNARHHPTSTGVDPNHIRTDLARYVSPNAVRFAILAFNQRNPSAPVALGTPPIDAVFVESVHQFQAKCFFETSQIDGLAGEATLDSLGLVKRRGMNAADRANAGAVKRLRNCDVPVQTGNEFTADNWFDSMVNPTFLGWRFTTGGQVRGVHLTFMRKLRMAERALLAQSRYFGMTPVELGQALGFSATSEEHKGARPNKPMSRSMHTYGLALDIRYGQNPWVNGADFTAALKHAALLVSGEEITDRTSAEFLHNLPAGRSTEQVFDIIARRDHDFRVYLALHNDAPELRRLLQLRRAQGTLGVFASVTEQVEQAARRWQPIIRGDLNNMTSLSSPFRDASKRLRNPMRGFLNLPKDLVVALRDKACLAWGAVDIGPGADGNGDMMHFDARVCGLGDRLAAEGNNFQVTNNHPCLPCATAGSAASGGGS